MLKGFAFSCVACCTAECITCPIDVVKTRLQLSGELGAKKMYGGVFDAVKQISRKEGVRALWKGLSPALIRQMTYGSARYGSYEPIKKRLGVDSSGNCPLWKKILAGALLALVNKIDAQVLFATTIQGGKPNDAAGADATLANCVVLRNDITFEDMNALVNELEASTYGLGDAGKAFLEENGTTVRDYFNYSDNPNCTGNPIKNAKLQLNGHDRFTTRDGAYFNYVQPFQHFEVTPCDGVNVYSFALKPIDHQPSGTCNFSRIDNTTLNLTTTYSSTGSSGDIKQTGKTGVVRIYCVNYNVFRVMSGMGGLAYSN